MRKRLVSFISVFCCLVLLLPLTVNAHSGRTDSNGGHNCSDTSIAKGLCTGYHYHNGGSDSSGGSSSTPSIKAKSSTSQASYKLTAYNSKGKKVYVNAPKNMVVTKVSGKSWYKGSFKYTSYKKVSGKWKKQTKTSTIYIPSSKVKKYTTKKTKWVKGIDEIETAYFKVKKPASEVVIPKGSSIYKTAKENGYLYVQDSKGKNVIAKTIESNNVYVDKYKVNDDFDKDGIADYKDNDVDNDSVLNDSDYDNDNDGIIDNIEYYYYQDDDKDGIANIDDDDYDQSNFNNITLDQDVDNDGISNDDDVGYVTKWNNFGENYYWVSYVDFDKKTTTKSVYKTTSSTRAYTKIYSGK